jgi:hypothetical protein
MKKLFWTLIAVFTFGGCFGQRYEIWVRTSSGHNYFKKNYGFSNDSILMTYSNPSLLFPSKDTYFTWDDITNLKVRNKSKNQFGQLLGASVGGLASYIVYNSMQKSLGESEAIGLYMIIITPTFTGIGTLIGHLATNKKTEIPLHGMNSKDRNQLLKSTIQKKN